MVSWLTPGQAAYLQGGGYYVFSDEQVNQRRNALQEAMPPSIDEVLTDEVINDLLAGNLPDGHNVQVPLDASEWRGVRSDERAERTRILEDSLILGIEVEEMTHEREAEARRLRAELRTVREVEVSLRERQAQTDL